MREGGEVESEVGDTRGLALSLASFAGLAARQQQWERAATLLGAAEAISGRTLPLATPAEYEPAVQGARAALGEKAFAAAWAAGRALSLDEAVKYAVTEGEEPR